MCSSSSGMLADLVGNFGVNLTYSESLSLSPELAVNGISLSGSADLVVISVGPSVGCARFEFF